MTALLRSALTTSGFVSALPTMPIVLASAKAIAAAVTVAALWLAAAAAEGPLGGASLNGGEDGGELANSGRGLNWWRLGSDGWADARATHYGKLGTDRACFAVRRAGRKLPVHTALRMSVEHQRHILHMPRWNMQCAFVASRHAHGRQPCVTYGS